MNFRTTILLAVLVVAGGAIWYFAGRGGDVADALEPATEPQSELRYMLDPRPETKDVEKLTITRPDQPTIEFVRTDEVDPTTKNRVWRMKHPVDAMTEGYMVDGLIGSFVGLQYRTRYEAGAAGAPADAITGLSAPLGVYTMTDTAGKEYKVEIGRKASLSNDTYLRAAGGTYLVQRDFTFDLKKKVSDYRAKSLFKVSRKDAARVVVEHEGVRYEAVRSGEDWVLESPTRAYADAEKVRAIVNAVASTRVTEYIDDAPASYATFGLESPALTATVITEETREVPSTQPVDSQPAEPVTETVRNEYTIAFGTFADMEEKLRYVRQVNQPWVASADKARVDEITAALKTLRDNRVARIQPDAVSALELVSGDQTASLRKTDAGWTGEGELASLDDGAVQSLLQAIAELRSVDFVEAPADEERFGFASPRAVLRITPSGQVEPIEIVVGSNTPSGRNTHVRVSNQGAIQIVAAAQADRLAIQPITLRSRVVFDVAPERIESISVARGGSRFELSRTGGVWTMTEPADLPHDPDRVAALALDLARLRAKAVVDRGEPERFALDQPEIMIEFVAAAPPPASAPSDAASQPSDAASQPSDAASQPAAEAPPPTRHTLRIARRDGVAYASKDDEPLVFELDASVFDVLSAELIRNALLEFDPSDVTSIGITRGEQSIELSRQGAEWVFALDPSVKLDAARVESLLTELRGWRAQRYLAYRDADLSEEWIESAPNVVVLTRSSGEPVTLRIDRPDETGQYVRVAWIEQKRAAKVFAGVVQSLPAQIDAFIAVEPSPDETPEMP